MQIEIAKLESAETNGKTWNGQPEWDCVCASPDGRRWLLSRQVQWNKPTLEHVQETAKQFPTLFQIL